MKKRFLVFFATIFVTLVSINTLYAQGEISPFDPNSPKQQVVEVIRLQPGADAEVILEDVEVKILSDGSIALSANGTYEVGEPTLAYDIVVDLERSTYTTSLVPLDELELHTPQKGISGENPDPNSDLKSGFRNAMFVSPGTYWAKIRVQTLDPVFIVVAETTNYLKWQVYGSGTVSWLSYTDGCWGANPSPLGTNWFVTSCSSASPYYAASNTKVYNAAFGNYQNWDFGNNSVDTNVSHWSLLGGQNNSSYTYSWSASDWGEGSGLLWSRIILN